MNRVKMFMGAANPEGLKFLENKINEWIENEKVKILNVSTSYGTRKGEGLSMEATEELFVIVAYEKE